MSSAAATTVVEHPPRSRSRAFNRQFMLPGTNGGSSDARFYRDCCLEFAELAGGVEALSASDRTMVITAATLRLKQYQLQVAMARGEQIDEETLTRISNSLNRTLAPLRRKARQPHPAGPNLTDYLASRGMRQA
jgi:hypothetical protein